MKFTTAELNNYKSELAKISDECLEDFERILDETVYAFKEEITEAIKESNLDLLDQLKKSIDDEDEIEKEFDAKKIKFQIPSEKELELTFAWEISYWYDKEYKEQLQEEADMDKWLSNQIKGISDYLYASGSILDYIDGFEEDKLTEKEMEIKAIEEAFANCIFPLRADYQQQLNRLYEESIKNDNLTVSTIKGQKYAWYLDVYDDSNKNVVVDEYGNFLTDEEAEEIGLW